MGRCLFAEHRRQRPRPLTDDPCPFCHGRISEGVIDLSIERFQRCQRTTAAQFWAQVSMPMADDAQVLLLSCWEHDNGISPLRAWGQSWTPQALSYALCWGDAGPWPIEAICDNSHCCNPYHLRVAQLQQPPLGWILTWPDGINREGAALARLCDEVRSALGVTTLPAPDSATP